MRKAGVEPTAAPHKAWPSSWALPTRRGERSDSNGGTRPALSAHSLPAVPVNLRGLDWALLLRKSSLGVSICGSKLFAQGTDHRVRRLSRGAGYMDEAAGVQKNKGAS